MTLSLDINVAPPYSITIAIGLLQQPHILDELKTQYQRFVVISDSNVAPLYGANWARELNAPLLTLPAGEQHKSRAQKAELEDAMLSHGCGRDTCVIAIGGGVVTDLAGFIAATYCRGIPAVYVPTTLLAMVDAAVGGKTGVNTPSGKNLIGAFKQPSAVLIDPNVLATLNPHQMTNGLIEAIKHGLIHDASLYQELITHANAIIHHQHDAMEPLIFNSINVKRHIVEQDTLETGLRQVLNLGHTVAHALEQCHHYKLAHGHAVAHGILIEAQVSCQLGLLSKDELSTLHRDFNTLPLQPLTLKVDSIEPLIQTMQLDKKAQQQRLYCVLLKSIGRVHHDSSQYSFAIEPDVMRAALQQYLTRETSPC